MTHNESYSIRVYKEYFNFSASHFLIFPDGTREPLHGHNYRVQLRGHALALSEDLVFDFLDIKPVVKEICDNLDHVLLLPKEHPKLVVEEMEDSYCILPPDQRKLVLPKDDVLFLPIENTSAERLAIFLANEIHDLVHKRFQFKFSKLEVEVEETPGQSAIYILDQK